MALCQILKNAIGYSRTFYEKHAKSHRIRRGFYGFFYDFAICLRNSYGIKKNRRQLP